LNATTPVAATSTPTFAITSLREHSNVLAMFTSSDRKRHNSNRHPTFAASAAAPNPNMIGVTGGTPVMTFQPNW